MKHLAVALTLTLLLFTSNANAAANNEIGELDIRADNTIITGTTTNTADRSALVEIILVVAIAIPNLLKT